MIVTEITLALGIYGPIQFLKHPGLRLGPESFVMYIARAIFSYCFGTSHFPKVTTKGEVNCHPDKEDSPGHHPDVHPLELCSLRNLELSLKTVLSLRPIVLSLKTIIVIEDSLHISAS